MLGFINGFVYGVLIGLRGEGAGVGVEGAFQSKIIRK